MQTLKNISREIAELIVTCKDLNTLQITRDAQGTITKIDITFNDGSGWRYTLAGGDEYKFTVY